MKNSRRLKTQVIGRGINSHPFRLQNTLWAHSLSNPYLDIPIARSYQRFLLFTIGFLHLRFVALPFELATAPRVFTKFLVTFMALN